MRRPELESDIAARWQVATPTLVSTVTRSAPITLSHIRCDAPEHDKTKPLPAEDAYVLHVMLSDLPSSQLWFHGRETPIPYVSHGGIFLFHYESDPVAAFHSPFEILRLSFWKTTLDDLADQAGLARPDGLKRRDHGAVDPVFYYLARSVAPLFTSPQVGAQLFLDHISLAFHAHLISAYGGRQVDPRLTRGRLAPWQERRAKEFMEENLSANVSLGELASVCELSPNHFARAFRKTTGQSPHRWLLERRIEAAKRMLLSSVESLEAAATLCGFSDASHLSRVFSRVAGEPPGTWRRRNRA